VPDTHEHQPSEIEDLVIAALLSEDPEEQREALVELTEHIDTLPTRLRAVVQEMTVSSQGEARLTYAAKNSTGLILSTPPAPLQEWSRFGGETDPGEWRNMLVFGDNLGVLAELLRMKQRGELKNTDGTNGVRVCYIDPPFATGREMEKAEIVAYRDKVEGAEFVEFLRRRLVLIRELLAEDGTLWVHLDTKKVHYIKVVLDEVFGEACFQSEVAWKRAAPKNFPGQKQPGRIKDTVLMYTRSTQTWVWNKQYIPYDADYIRDFYKYDDGDGRGLYQRDQLMATGNNPQRQIEWRGSKPGAGRVWLYDVARLEELHADGRVYIAPAGGIHRMKRYLVEQPGVQLQDMWLDINNVSKPRYPTEKPQMLLERVITASSNAGDLVLDCFAGSGSTLRAAEHLGRRWIGVDCGKLSIHTATRDLLTTPGPDGAAVQPFSVFHAGLYNPEALGDLDAEAWVKFVLDLF
jgi:site-specific DNA-methyltransferase (adenine-specific)/adenine-specific DNA-methyltransferase